jgi:hypothetical protein
MVGGKVIGLARGPESTLVHVQDVGKYHRDECSIRVIERRLDNGEPVEIQVGDKIWWQAGTARWTPQTYQGDGSGKGCGILWEIRLRKVGYSH